MGALSSSDASQFEDWEAIEGAIASGSDEHLALTPLGRHLARLPVHPRLGKMLVYGTLFGCLGERRRVLNSSFKSGVLGHVFSSSFGGVYAGTRFSPLFFFSSIYTNFGDFLRKRLVSF